MIDQAETADRRNGEGRVLSTVGGAVVEDGAETGTPRRLTGANPPEQQREVGSTAEEESQRGGPSAPPTPSIASHAPHSGPLPVPHYATNHASHHLPGVVQSPVPNTAWGTTSQSHNLTADRGWYDGRSQPPGQMPPYYAQGWRGPPPGPMHGFVWGTIVPGPPPRENEPWYMKRKFWFQVAVGVLGLLAVAAFVRWLLPLLINKVVLPAMNGLRRRVSRPALAILIVLAEAVLPTLLMPTSPPGWLAGIVFRWGWGFLIVTVGTTLGFIPPFFLGRLLFSGCVRSLLEERPKLSALMALPGRGGFWRQFRVVILLRFSPVPFQILNYLLATTPVMFWPYLLGSSVSQIPGTFIDIYTGIVLKDLADYVSGKRKPDSVQTIAQIAGILLSIVAVLCVTYYCRQVLKQLSAEDQVLTEINLANHLWSDVPPGIGVRPELRTPPLNISPLTLNSQPTHPDTNFSRENVPQPRNI